MPECPRWFGFGEKLYGYWVRNHKFTNPGWRLFKRKRSVLKKILKRTQNEFNVSIAETGNLDNYKLAEIGFAVVGNDSRYINGKVDQLLMFIDKLHAAEMLNSKIEIMVVSSFLEETDWKTSKYDEL